MQNANVYGQPQNVTSLQVRGSTDSTVLRNKKNRYNFKMGKSTVPLLGKIFLSKFSFSTLEIDKMIDEKNGKSNLTRANVQN